MDFFSAPEVIENDDEEIDMFAELGITILSKIIM
jgi:hypothetical protein